MQAHAVSISVNELESTLRKALAAMHFPYGADAEGAALVRILECAGQGGVQLFLDALPLNFPRAMPLIAGSPHRFNGAAAPGIALAPPAVDSALLHGASSVENADSPLWFAAAACAAARPDVHFKLHWQCAKKHWQATAAPGALQGSGDPPAKSGLTTITAITAANPPPPATIRADLHLPAHHWQQLKTLAARSLVPATQTSREQGAGGGDAND